MKNKSLNCKSKLYYNFTWLIKLIMLLPAAIYYCCKRIIIDFSNKYFEIVSIILFVISFVWIMILFVLDFCATKKRKKIYDSAVIKEDYIEAKNELLKLLKIPMSRSTYLSILFIISLIDIRRMNFEDSKKSLINLKEVNKYYCAGIYFDFLSNYYILLIQIYHNEHDDLAIREFLDKYENVKIRDRQLLSFLSGIKYFIEKNYDSFVKCILSQNTNNAFLLALADRYSNNIL